MTTVKATIALLCAGAAVLIVVVLSDPGGSDTGAWAGLTALVVVFFLLTGMAGATLARNRPELAWFGYLTATASAIALVGTTYAIWGDLDEGGGKFIAGSAVFALAGAHASLLLSSRHEDRGNVRLLRNATLTLLSVLALLVIYAIARSGGGLSGREVAIVAILYLLGATVLPLARRSAAKAPGPVGPTSPAAGEGVLKLDHVVIGVIDLTRSNRFYEAVLGATVVALPGNRTAYRIGGQQLNVHDPATAAAPLAADLVRPGNSDLCFVWDGPVAAMVEHVRRHGIDIVEGPVERQGTHGPGQSVYFRDPDGSLLELISYQG